MTPVDVAERKNELTNRTACPADSATRAEVCQYRDPRRNVSLAGQPTALAGQDYSRPSLSWRFAPWRCAVPSPKLLVLVTLLAAALCVPVDASGQVLNLSTDLVAKGIASSNMLPNMPALDARPLLQAGVAYASLNNIPRVVAERGAYYFLSLNSPRQHVFLNQISNVTVDLRHSDLYFTSGNIEAIGISGGTNLTLKHFTVDYLPQALPFTELTVTSVNAAGSPPTIDFTPISGYPLPSALSARAGALPTGYINDGFFAYVFRNGQELAGTGRMSVSTPLNDSTLTLAGTEPWTQAAELGTIEPGDTLVVELRAGVGSIFADATTGLTVQDVSIYASGFIGVLTHLSSATTVDHVQVIPRPGTGRLISTNADGIHLGKAGANNVITNNTIKRTCDDAIAMDGQWYAIVAAGTSSTSTDTVQVTRNNTGILETGQFYDFIDIDTALILGTATITAENPSISAQTGAAGEAITLTISPALAGLQPNFGVTPNDPNLRGSGTVISGNLAQEITFGRGIYPAGVANVSIHDNMTEATNRSGIVVEQDEGLIYNYKTGPSSGIAILNNIVDKALGYGIPSANAVTDAAGINVVAYDEHFAWLNTQSLTGITIENNFVTNGIRTGIRVENVNGGQVSGNTVLGNSTAPDSDIWFLPPCPGSSGCETLAQVEADFAQPISVIQSTSVTNTSNVTTGPLVRNQSFADGSYRFAPTSIVVASGQNFTKRTETASGPALPHKLAGVQVRVLDSAGTSRLAGLYAASPSAVTFVMPEGTAPGVATVTVADQAGGALVSSAAPGLFSADGTGSGVALATAVRETLKGKQVVEPVYECTPACAAVPLDLGNPGDTTLVTFQGTGIRGLNAPQKMVAEVGGVLVHVEAAGRVAGAGPGMDYVTLKIPRSLAGAGLVPVTLTVEGFTSNAVSINIQ
jgi:uncharacterized protein (TIGR03437 family)